MDFKSIALSMFPLWLLGAGIVAATIGNGKKEVVRVEISPILRFLRFLFILTAYRVLLFKIFPSGKLHDSAMIVTQIPWQATLTVAWEDAVFGLPLLLIKGFIGNIGWKRVLNLSLMAASMFIFGRGHLYQGVIPAILLSCYIPFAVKQAEKFGYGTIMLCHILFDLTTVITLKAIIGA